MKKGFTLVELLIVVAVMVILMGLVVRLGSSGTDSSRRSRTLARMQRVENCLSGYFAAYGSYPQVKNHGAPDYTYKVNGHGIQLDTQNANIWGWSAIGEKAEQTAWRQVEAACRVQPVGCAFPYPDHYNERVQAVSNELKRRAASSESRYASYRSDPEVLRRLMAGFDDGVTSNPGRHSQGRNETDWREIQLFKFGLMSFLLPKYLVMMNGDEVFFRNYRQWTDNNMIPANPLTGERFANWHEVQQAANHPQRSENVKVENIASQIACARWLPNLAETCRCEHKFTLYGVNIRTTADDHGGLDIDNPNVKIYSPGGAESDSTGSQYVLDEITVVDGWGNELYYHSPPPYQNYTLWSSGANGRTFPPWIARERLSAKENKCVALWTQDDIKHLNN